MRDAPLTEMQNLDAPPPQAGLKDLYEIGEMPPLGHVPAKMYAWAIRRERHGAPEEAMQVEVMPTPELGEHDVLVHVMAAGVNYNGVWAARGEPLSPSIFTAQTRTSRAPTRRGSYGP